MLEGKNPFRAAKDGDLATIETYILTRHDLSSVDADGKQVMHHAVEGGHSTLFPVLGIQAYSIRDTKSVGGWDAFVALKLEGSVEAWGNNKDHLGHYRKVEAQLVADVQHVYATSGAFAALKADGTVVAWGARGGNDLDDRGGDCSKVLGQLVDVQHIYARCSSPVSNS